MRRKPIHILLLESNPADVRFIRDALAELEELQYGNSWLSPYEITDVESVSEATCLLKEATFDVILADLNSQTGLGSSANGIDALRRLRAVSQHTPIIAVTPREDPAFSIRLLQEGVEDVLVKYELDCAPLGRSLRAAIERQRRTQKQRNFSIRDELSGLLNFSGFVQLGDLLASLVARSSLGASVVIFTLENFEQIAENIGQQEEEWLLLECAELLRESSRNGDLVSYIGVGRFAWLAVERPEVSLRADLAAQESALACKFLQRGHPISLRYRVGIANLDESTGCSLLMALEAAEQAAASTRIAFDELPLGPPAIQ
jgi:PleD family two-component response regulator